jgi:hypothetical protein
MHRSHSGFVGQGAWRDRRSWDAGSPASMLMAVQHRLFEKTRLVERTSNTIWSVLIPAKISRTATVEVQLHLQIRPSNDCRGHWTWHTRSHHIAGDDLGTTDTRDLKGLPSLGEHDQTYRQNGEGGQGVRCVAAEPKRTVGRFPFYCGDTVAYI